MAHLSVKVKYSDKTNTMLQSMKTKLGEILNDKRVSLWEKLAADYQNDGLIDERDITMLHQQTKPTELLFALLANNPRRCETLYQLCRRFKRLNMHACIHVIEPYVGEEFIGNLTDEEVSGTRIKEDNEETLQKLIQNYDKKFEQLQLDLRNQTAQYEKKEQTMIAAINKLTLESYENSVKLTTCESKLAQANEKIQQLDPNLYQPPPNYNNNNGGMQINHNQEIRTGTISDFNEALIIRLQTQLIGENQISNWKHVIGDLQARYISSYHVDNNFFKMIENEQYTRGGIQPIRTLITAFPNLPIQLFKEMLSKCHRMDCVQYIEKAGF